MPAAQGASPDPGLLITVIVLGACVCVVYWRIALRIVVIALITLAIYGAVLLVAGLHRILIR